MSAIYDERLNTVFVSAYELCAYALRGGDIDNRTFKRGNKNGGAIVSHQMKPQKPSISDAYSVSLMYEGITINVYTYPEGIRREDDGSYTIEKIHTVPYNLDDISNGELEISISAIITSAYIAFRNLGGSKINARLVFIKDGDDEMRTFAQELSREEAELHFNSMVDMVSPFLKIIASRAHDATRQLSALKFPFKGGVRDAQKDFILEAFRAIKARKRLMVQAPTGTGKTMASLYPSLKSIGEGYADKIFYFTGKATTAYSALNAVEIMREALPDFRSILISSKDKCCTTFKPNETRKCDPKSCPRAQAYYDKINVALLDLLENYRTYTKEVIDKIAEKYCVCSYELSLELSEWCELIVCDYNYLFDLQVYLRRYFTAPDASYIFLIDEAHNLPDRAREMYSSTLLRSTFKSLQAKYPNNKHISEAIEGILSKFDTFYELAMAEKREYEGQYYGFYITTQLPDDIENEFLSFTKGAEKLFSRDVNDDELKDVYYEVKHMLKVCEIFDKRFTMYIEAIGDEVKLRLMCLDVSKLLDTAMKKGRSSILFSATLTPPEYFADILGCERTEALNLPSPFERDNLCLLGINNISTRYEDREKSAMNVANVIRATIAGKVGNYIVYFPSYSYLSEVKEAFQKRYPKINITAQSKSMSERAKKEFLDSFDTKKEGTLVGFCVLGGSFSEGIDLRGERLIGAIIVGVGLPTISTELNIVKEYFDKTRENGYAYAYTYPGMIKVLQAAGRVIRSEEERGVVVLIDDRFATPEYHDLIPEHWKHLKFLTNANDLLSEVTEFWKK
ncbi:MAG: ATP-dependent DNA helicase [Clostridia bacterium]|nr:ATP-dependent DNA helicase [Clostridia bacterium]